MFNPRPGRPRRRSKVFSYFFFGCGGFFFFQAEDGIRDLTVTGVQTCALPISSDCGSTDGNEELYCAFTMPQATGADVLGVIAVIDLQDSASPLPAWWHLEASGRSEERRVGKECRSRWSPYH